MRLPWPSQDSEGQAEASQDQGGDIQKGIGGERENGSNGGVPLVGRLEEEEDQRLEEDQKKVVSDNPSPS